MLDLALWFALLSLLAVGGMSTVMPEMQRVVVQENGWMTPAEFTQLFAISQAAPGPNVLIAALVCWKVGGIAGALVALGAMTLLAALLAWQVDVVWERFRDAAWRATVQRALLPVSVGLVLAGGYLLATPAGLDGRSALIAGASAAALVCSRANPLWILSAGGSAGYLLF